ncbi:uncharacterized protein (DUF1800 family) [Sphingomonas vulcanisoli]|uniref:Uncharacterized protein (DUF1800 family) n=1 Tax=Sphingomonas vulcanisoli TaxID=1658060 RepID=A0ABX0TLV8_9SPHN|nr:DUF1800 domain-containing protein [Sphingomonas vulcanisoli]NIJ06497.1 uncharacterized protein (DUF1800 family) [Sphingomonas vulcanisoli]
MQRTIATIAGVLLAQAASAASPGGDRADLALADRMSWGLNDATLAALDGQSGQRWLEAQLRMPADVALPAEAQQQIDAMRITREPMANLVVEMDADNKAKAAIPDPDQKKAAQQAYQQAMRDLMREAQARSLLRDLYSPAQLREQMTWFWFNHFNVQAQKRDVRAMIGDYEDQAIRPHALGKFRDLLEATLRHPAMLRYLDNDQNAANHINENYAREIMELHSMGVGSGYTQKDVQELARILTGVGVDQKPDNPRLKPEWQPLLVRAGLFEFNPQRHDFGTKTFLGHEIKGSGFGEVEEALDLIARSPATAAHISNEIATFFMGDNPPPALVQRMAATFQHSDGDTAAVIRTMAKSPEFKASLGKTFKDPIHYVVSSLRLAYGDRVIANPEPALGWIDRMGEGLYAHETPDGYPMTSAAWTGPGQMSVRFEIARQIGGGARGLFTPRGAPQPLAPTAVTLQNAAFTTYFQSRLAPPTQTVLSQAPNPPQWNALFLSAPEFMLR